MVDEPGLWSDPADDPPEAPRPDPRPPFDLLGKLEAGWAAEEGEADLHDALGHWQHVAEVEL